MFSPQYLIWIGAAVSALAALQPERRGLWLSFLAAVLLSQLIFPRGYPILKAFHPLGVLVLNVRNFALIGFAIGLVRCYSDPNHSERHREAPAPNATTPPAV